MLLNESNEDEFPVEPYLNAGNNDNDGNEAHFLDEIDITTDAIVHQSPFNVKMFERVSFLKQIVYKEPLKRQTTNSLFSIKLVHLFHKWFAYGPLWSGIMTEFIDRQVVFFIKKFIILIAII